MKLKNTKNLNVKPVAITTIIPPIFAPYIWETIKEYNNKKVLVISKKGQKFNENFCITIVHSHNRNEMRGLVRSLFKVAFVSLSFPKYFYVTIDVFSTNGKFTKNQTPESQK